MLPRMGLLVNEISTFAVTSDNGVRSRLPAAVATASGLYMRSMMMMNSEQCYYPTSIYRIQNVFSWFGRVVVRASSNL